MTSQRQKAANQANARRSTGPQTPEGKAVTRLNALRHGLLARDVVLNILSRHRDPGPAATILTPDALRLRHLPIADCARYDSLRRAC